MNAYIFYVNKYIYKGHPYLNPNSHNYLVYCLA